MWYAGIDLHRRTAVVAMVDDARNRVRPRTYQCSRPGQIAELISKRRPFRAVIEASCAYRWLHDLLVPHGEVVPAHPLLSKSIWNTRAKTDKKDAEELAELLRSDRILRAYIPPERYQGLRDLTRERARMVWGRTEAENTLHSILWRMNMESRFASLSGKGTLKWLESVELPAYLAPMRDERFERVRYFKRTTARLDADLARIAEGFPETAALMDRGAPPARKLAEICWQGVGVRCGPPGPDGPGSGLCADTAGTPPRSRTGSDDVVVQGGLPAGQAGTSVCGRNRPVPVTGGGRRRAPVCRQTGGGVGEARKRQLAFDRRADGRGRDAPPPGRIPAAGPTPDARSITMPSR